jgi:hypothetical protein
MLVGGERYPFIVRTRTKNMNPNGVYGYILSLCKTGKDAELDETSLDILELFAVHREKYLSAYQICKLKSTSRKLAYKNVNRRVKTLSLSGLIQKKQIKSNHNAIHYMLTEYGIYQLFSKKFTSSLLSQPHLGRGKMMANDYARLYFLHNYSNSRLFKIFLYPYFKKKTLLAIGGTILRDLYKYLSTCCHRIDGSEEPIEQIVNDAVALIEQLIYRFVYQLAAPETSEEFSSYRENLSQDDKFMKAVKQIYENRHKCFEAGYNMLTNSS